MSGDGLRLAHVVSTPEGVGGAERVLSALLESGAAAGHSQLVLNPFAVASDGGELGELCREADPAVEFAALPCASALRLRGLRAELARRLSAHRPAVVHAHLFHAMVLVASLRRRLDASLVLTHHHGDHNVAERRRLRARIDRAAGRRFDRVVAISRYVSRFLQDAYGYDEERLVLIRNGWSGTPAPKRPHERPTIVCVARLREQKGHEDLLRAVAALGRRGLQARLDLVGDGPLHDRLSALARDLGIGDRVAFAGDVRDVWPHLARADVFALASRYEPLGVAVMEAMAAGLPVVATSVGGVPELLDPGFSQLVEPYNPEALADALAGALTNDSRGEQLASLARAQADRFTAARMTAAYEELYRSLVPPGRP